MAYRQDELEVRLRNLARKWVAQAHHPIRTDKPEEREILEKCAAQLLAELHYHGGSIVPWPRGN